MITPCPFNPTTFEVSNIIDQDSEPKEMLKCPVCGMLCIPGLPHPTSEQLITDRELEALALDPLGLSDWS